MSYKAGQDFTVGEVIRYSWEAAKSNVILFFIVLCVSMFIMYVPLLVLSLILGSSNPVVSLVNILMIPVNLIIAMGMLKIPIKVVDGDEVYLGDLFSSYRLTLTYLISGILSMIAIMVGYMFLVIPGIYLALRFMFAPYLIIDKGMGAIESLQHSGDITRGEKWKMIQLFLAMMVINVIGVITIVGVFVTIPMAMISMAYFYRMLEPGVEPEVVHSVEEPVMNSRPAPGPEYKPEQERVIKPEPAADLGFGYDAGLDPRPQQNIGSSPVPEAQSTLGTKPGIEPSTGPSAQPSTRPGRQTGPEPFPV